MSRYIILTLVFLQLVILPSMATGLKLTVGDNQPIIMSRYFTTVLPGKSIVLKVESSDISKLIITSDYGRLISKGDGRWKYVSPQEPGNYSVVIKDGLSKDEIVLVVFVLTPATDQVGEYLNDYRIGNYPEDKYKGSSKYSKPEGFIEVNEANKDVFITPHFQLKQFLCKQESGWPKYLLVNPVLLVKLEHLIDGLAARGNNVSTLFIMSGYRTPYYNKAIGNVKYSRHIFGDAADIYVDEDLDGVIDDLDSDSKSNMLDAMVLHELLSDLENDPENEHLVGGIGKYKKNSAHTYFIHVDTRGYRARW